MTLIQDVRVYEHSPGGDYDEPDDVLYEEEDDIDAMAAEVQRARLEAAQAKAEADADADSFYEEQLAPFLGIESSPTPTSGDAAYDAFAAYCGMRP